MSEGRNRSRVSVTSRSGRGGSGGRQQGSGGGSHPQHPPPARHNPGPYPAPPASPWDTSNHPAYYPHMAYGQAIPGTAPTLLSRDPMGFPSAPYMTAGSITSRPSRPRIVAEETAGTHGTIAVAGSQFKHFSTIFKLEAIEAQSSVPALNNLYASAYRTSNRFADRLVFLRRVVNAPVSADHAKAVFDSVIHFRHPALVSIRDVKVTNEFVLGSNDLIMEYRYIHNAKGLKSLVADFSGARRDPKRIEINASESLLWTIACQLESLLRTFHQVDYALPGLHISKLIYVEEGQRVMFTGLGLIQAVLKDATCSPLDDIVRVGEVLFQLATRSLQLPISREDAHQRIQGTKLISPAMENVIITCLYGNADVDALFKSLGYRISMEVGHQAGHVDNFINQCQKSQHGGRLLKLVMKLNMIVAFTEDHGDDTLRLFFQYVFKQVDGSHRPKLDWGHAYHSLNKLDIGSDELVQLVAEDSSTINIVSYQDIRNLLEDQFVNLQRAGMADPSNIPPMYADRGANVHATHPQGRGHTPQSMNMMGGYYPQ